MLSGVEAPTSFHKGKKLFPFPRIHVRWRTLTGLCWPPRVAVDAGCRPPHTPRRRVAAVLAKRREKAPLTEPRRDRECVGQRNGRRGRGGERRTGAGRHPAEATRHVSCRAVPARPLPAGGRNEGGWHPLPVLRGAPRLGLHTLPAAPPPLRARGVSTGLGPAARAGLPQTSLSVHRERRVTEDMLGRKGRGASPGPAGSSAPVFPAHPAHPATLGSR